MSVIAQQGQGLVVRAVVYPACKCGAAYTAHVPTGATDCQGYQPVRPIVDLGTRAYASNPSLPLLARIGCEVAWRVERRLQGWRERLDRR